MAASDHLSAGQFFHGSPNEMQPGDEVHLSTANQYGYNRRPGAYASSDLATAAAWGRMADHSQGNRVHVYQVAAEPGSYKRDYMGRRGDIVSRQPLRVTGEVRMVYTPPAPAGHPRQSVDGVRRTVRVANWKAAHHTDLTPRDYYGAKISGQR